MLSFQGEKFGLLPALCGICLFQCYVGTCWLPHCRVTETGYSGCWSDWKKQVCSTQCKNTQDFFFFFCWRYSSLWALACRTISLHFSLSITNSLHLLTPITWRSLLLLSILSWVFLFVSFLPVLEWKSFSATYPPPFSPGDPANLSFAPLSILLYFLLYSTLLILDFVILFHSPPSYLGPYILLNIFLSKISRAYSSFFVMLICSYSC